MRTPKTPRRSKPAGRPRDPETTSRILAAALELGMQSGFEALTVEGVAARAGVGKTTIYRRWQNVWSIVADAVLADVDRVAPLQERAAPRESLRESMRLAARYFRGRRGSVLRALIGRAQIDSALHAALIDRWLLARAKSRRIIEQGIAAHELRSGLDPDIVLDALYGPLYHRLLLPYGGARPDLSDAYVDAVIDTVFAGIARAR